MKLYYFLFFYLIAFSSIAQENKKVINQETYAEWKTIAKPQLSKKGNLISFETKQQENDRVLTIYNAQDKSKTAYKRAENAILNTNEKWVSFTIKNSYDSIRSLKLAKTKKKKWPSDSLGIYLVEKDLIIKFNLLKNYKTGAESNNWIALLRTNKYKKSYSKKEQKKRKKLKRKNKLPKSKGTVLTLYNPLTGYKKDIDFVKNYAISNNGKVIFWNTILSYSDTIDSTHVYRFNTEDLTTKMLQKHKGSITKLTSSWTGYQFAYLASSDTGKVKKHQIYYWNNQLIHSKVIVDTLASNFSIAKSPSINYSPYFSENGNYLFFGIGNKPKIEPKDTLTEEEKYNLDIWSWTDKRLQPQQLKNLEKEKKVSDLYVYNISTQKITQLTDSSLHVRTYDKWNNNKYLLLSSQTPYYKELSWDDWYFDYYRLNVETGVKKRLKTHHNSRFNLSPSGKYAAYYSKKDSAWYAIDIELEKETRITHKKVYYSLNHDTPGEPNPAGKLRWNKDETVVLISGQFDYWEVKTNGTSEKRITKGREYKIAYSYWKTSNKKIKYYDLETPNYFIGKNKETKSEGVWKLENKEMVLLANYNKKFFNLIKAEKTDSVLFSQMSFQEYPELKLGNLDFRKPITISNTNPQQNDYNWGTVELVHWNSFHNNDSLTGLLYKPENFDSTKKYPMIVYFYERYSDRLHYYYKPKPTASIIYPTEYVSNGYLVFIPDVKYKVGHPAQGAYDCIVSGTDYLTQKHSYIDATKIGIQGQSWGGYQVAQLITMTNKYKCAMAGAPVSNMFSAYGGIRWGSGLSRAFQYENGQSRIGKTIWDAPELYVENSPIFHLKKVNTPLLIMHNDGDGAVPWYQGIELFTGLRRLNQPVWMFNYNGDQHNLRKLANKKDLSIRMKQFFDYYLKDEKQPTWMKSGRPAIVKGKENRY